MTEHQHSDQCQVAYPNGGGSECWYERRQRKDAEAARRVRYPNSSVIGVNQYVILRQLATGPKLQAEVKRGTYRQSSMNMAVISLLVKGYITRTNTKPYLLKITAEGSAVLAADQAGEHDPKPRVYYGITIEPKGGGWGATVNGKRLGSASVQHIKYLIRRELGKEPEHGRGW